MHQHSNRRHYFLYCMRMPAPVSLHDSDVPLACERCRVDHTCLLAQVSLPVSFLAAEKEFLSAFPVQCLYVRDACLPVHLFSTHTAPPATAAEKYARHERKESWLKSRRKDFDVYSGDREARMKRVSAAFEKSCRASDFEAATRDERRQWRSQTE